MAEKKIKLLVVDDEKDICNFVNLLFSKKGFSVHGALSGTQAVRTAKKVKPDIALLDIHLGGALCGIEVLKKLREVVPACRNVMVTWDKEAAKMKEAKQLGAVAYLTKPLTTTQLFKVVDGVVKRARKGGLSSV